MPAVQESPGDFRIAHARAPPAIGRCEEDDLHLDAILPPCECSFSAPADTADGSVHRPRGPIARPSLSLHRRRRVVPAPGTACPTAGPAAGRSVPARSRHPDPAFSPARRSNTGEHHARSRRGFWYFDLSVPPLPEVVKLASIVGRIFVTCHSQMAAYRQAGVPRSPLPPARPRSVGRPSRYACPRAIPLRSLVRRIGTVSRPLRRCCAAWPRSAGCRCGVPVGKERRQTFPWRVDRFRQGVRRVVHGAAISLGANATAHRTPRLPALPIGSGRSSAAAASSSGPGSRASSTLLGMESTASGIVTRTTQWISPDATSPMPRAARRLPPPAGSTL